MRTKSKQMLSLALACASTATFADSPTVPQDKHGSSYRVINPEAGTAVNPYRIALADINDALPERFVSVRETRAMPLREALERVLDGSGISVVFIGDESIPSRPVAGLAIYGHLKAVLDTIMQTEGLQYILRDGVLRVVTTRPNVLAYPDASETNYLADLVSRQGGKVLNNDSAAASREILFQADYAAVRRIRADLADLHALKLDPSRRLITRAVLVPAAQDTRSKPNPMAARPIAPVPPVRTVIAPVAKESNSVAKPTPTPPATAVPPVRTSEAPSPQPPSSTPGTPAKPPTPVPAWVLAADKPLHAQLAEWATRAGWKLEWQLKKTWVVPSAVHFEGTFDQAIEKVVEMLYAQGKPIHLKLWEGNKIAEIVETSPQ